MNFQLTREQELVKQMVREFAVNEVKPIAAEIDETERFPMENVCLLYTSDAADEVQLV